VRRRLAHGHHVTVFGRGSTVANVPECARVIVGDRSRLEASAAAFRDLRPDVVVDASAFTEEETISRREALARTVAWDRDHAPQQADSAQFDYAAEDAILGHAIG
jgi:hypothetical protein